MNQLKSVKEVIDALGGMPTVAELTGRSPGVVWNWKDRKTFPSNTYAVLKAALKARGIDAPGSLWNMAEAS